jgi:hypothetical protein
MSPTFEWYFGWQTTAEGSREGVLLFVAQPARPIQWRWPARLVPLLLLGLAAIVGARHVQQWLAVAEDETTQAVSQAYLLLWDTAVQADSELFPLLLSPRDPAWLAAEQQIFDQGLLFDRASLGLPLAERAVTPRILGVSLAPDLAQAVVVAAHPYTSSVGQGLTKRVTLRQTAVFQRDAGHWRLAPPASAFWGQWDMVAGQRLELTYPARDKPIAARLARDLEARLAELCRQRGLVDCPADLSLSLKLSSDSASLAVMADADNKWLNGQHMVLPTPTLVGLPGDETAYQALLHGYAAYVATAVIINVRRWQGCNPVILYQGLWAGQLICAIR